MYEIMRSVRHMDRCFDATIRNAGEMDHVVSCGYLKQFFGLSFFSGADVYKILQPIYVEATVSRKQIFL
jgi:hypothetical protein